MWNRVDQSLPNNQGFDQDKTLPFRERLIIIAYDDDPVAHRTIEAYVHDGKWHYWKKPILGKVYPAAGHDELISDSITIIAWAEYPEVKLSRFLSGKEIRT